MALPHVPSNCTGLTPSLTPLPCPDGFFSSDSVSVRNELGSFQQTKRRRIDPTPQMLASLLEEEASPPSSPVAPRMVSMPAPPESTVEFITELMPSLRLDIHDDGSASGNSMEKENGMTLPAKPMPLKSFRSSKSYGPSKLYSTTLGNSASDNKMAT